MPHKCDNCGEFAPCRKIYSFSPGMFPMHHGFSCKKCDDAGKILDRILSKKVFQDKTEEQQAWIKKRDKILKENSQ